MAKEGLSNTGQPSEWGVACARVLLLMMCAIIATATHHASAQAVAARGGATTAHLRRITPIIPDANRFDPGKVFLENADALVADENRSTEYRVLRGNVRFRRGDMTLRCDSAYFYEATSSLDAFGHVVMNQADTMTVYCDRMHYFGDVEVAKLRRNVRVVNSSMTVTTDSLDYDMFNNVARYFSGGTVVDKSGTRITSSVARYEHDTKKVQFTSKVHLKNDKLELFTDILDYNMHTHIATIEDETKIISLADGHTIYTSSGWYNLSDEDGTLYNRSTIKAKDGQTIVGDVVYYDRKNDKGQAQGNVVLTDEKNQRTLTGDVVDYDRKRGIGRARGNVVIIDEKNKVILQGEVGYHNEKTRESYVTERALAREFSQKDTIYIHADTLRTITVEKDMRVLIANKYVRFFRKDLQGVCDSAAVSEQDSILNLYRHAVVWSEGRQIYGEEINVHVKDSVVDWATLPKPGMLIEHLGEDYYNQLGGRTIKATFENQELRQLDVSGDVEALFYPMEKDSTYNKLVNASSAYLTINMKPKQEVEKIKMWPDVSGKVIPLYLAKRSDLRLDKFRWYDSIRPKDPDDVMVVSDEMRQIFGEPVITRRTVINR